MIAANQGRSVLRPKVYVVIRLQVNLENIKAIQVDSVSIGELRFLVCV